MSNPAFWLEMPTDIVTALTRSHWSFQVAINTATQLLMQCYDRRLPWPTSVGFDESCMLLIWRTVHPPWITGFAGWPGARGTEIAVHERDLYIDEMYPGIRANAKSMPTVLRHLIEFCESLS